MRHLTPGKYRGLSRISDEDGFFSMIAVSQRPAVEQLVAKLSADQHYNFKRIAELKSAILSVWSRHASAVMVDPQYAYPAALSRISHKTGLILAVEQGNLESTPRGILNHLFKEDIVAKAKRLGVDAINLSLWFRPDASSSVVNHQKDLVDRVGNQCREFDLPFLLSPLLYSLPNEHPVGNYAELAMAMVREFQQERYGVDALQLENPLPGDGSGTAADHLTLVQEFFSALGATVSIPWIMLTAGSGIESFRESLRYAFRAGASGYLGGRALWSRQAESYPDLETIAHLIETDMVPVAKQLQQLTRNHAKPWHEAIPKSDRPPFSSANFYETYPGLSHSQYGSERNTGC